MPNWKKVIVSGSDAVLNKATLSDNLLVTPTTQSAAHSGLLLGFSKYSANFEAGLFAAPDGRIGGSNGNLYIAPRNINDGNGSYLQLGQRDSSTASDKGTVILQAGRSGSNSQVGDMFFGYGDQKIMKLHGATGNVGIGNLLPTEKLQVEGNISASGTGSFTNINMRGDIIPLTDATHNLGDTASRDWNTLFVRTIDIHNQRVNISAAGTTAIFSDHSSVGDGFQFYHLGTEILRLGNDGDYTANFSANITASGDISSSGTITGNNLIATGSTATSSFAGNIGIGTTSPSQTLEVHSTIKIGETGVTGGRLISGDSMIFQIDSDASSGTSSYRFRANGTGDDGTELMRIGENGKVGIGTITPTEALQIEGNISASGTGSFAYGLFSDKVGIGLTDPDEKLEVDGNIKISADKFYQMGGGSNKIGVDGGNVGMHFHTGDGTERMIISSSGNVGIGITTPTEKLQVEGNISSSGTGSFSVLGVGLKSPFLPLHVDGDARIDGNLLVGNCASTNTPAADLHLKSSGTDAKIRIEDLDDDNLAYDFLVNSGSGLTITETTDATSRIHIKQGNGRVGIGTAGPSAQLQVHSQDSNFEILRLVGDTTEHGSLKIYSGSYNAATIGYHQQGYFHTGANSSNPNGAFFIRADKGIDFGTNNTGSLSIQSQSANVIIDSKVKVGIGTASPGEKLEVTGNISASGTGSFSNGVFTSNVGIGGAPGSKTLNVTGTIQSSGEAFWSHFDNLTSNSRFRDDLALFFGVNRQLGWRYNSTLDKLVLTSGSAHTLTLDGDGNVSGSGNISASFFHGDGSGLSNISATLPAEVVSASAGHITASGDISSSGNLSAGGGTLFLGDDVSIFDDGTNILRTDDIFHANNNIHVGGDGKLIDRADTDNFIELASIINMSTDISVTGDVTASGVISASGDGHIFGGAVGIGTSPAAGIEFHVNGDVRVDSTDGVATRKIRADYFSSTTDITLQPGSSGSVIIPAGYERALLIGTSTPAALTEKLVVEGNISGSGTGSFSDGRFTGKVGIGATSPSELLELKPGSGGDSKINIVNSSGVQKALIGYDNGNGGLINLYNEAGTRNVVVRGYGNSYFNGGNFGIGTTTPTEKLQVEGNISASGTGSFENIVITSNDANIVSGSAFRVSKGASPIGNIRYDTVVIEANDVATIRIGESDGTVSSIMSGDSNMRINSTHPMKFFTAGSTTGEAHGGQGGTLALTLDNSQDATFAGNVLIADNKNLDFGAATDFRIVHNSGTNVNHISSKLDRQLSLNANIINFTNQANDDTVVRVSGSKVGIGTTAPTEKLQVEGNISASGNVEATSFTGSLSGTVTGNIIGNATGLTGTPDIVVGSLTATSITSSIVTSSILFTEGSNIFGDVTSDFEDTHTFNGHITASGNISASGNLYAQKYYIHSTKETYIGSSDSGDDLLLEAVDDIRIRPTDDVLLYGNDDTIYTHFDGANKRVGIGTSIPTKKLHVSGAISASMHSAIRTLDHGETLPQLLIEGNMGGFTPALGTAIELRSNIDYRGRGIHMTTATGSEGEEWFAGVPYTGGGYQIGYDGSNGFPYYKASSSLFINESGNVGVGTVNQGRKLDVEGTFRATGNTDFLSNVSFSQSADGGVGGFGSILEKPSAAVHTLRFDSNRFRFWAGGSERLTLVSASGNIGIGQSDPSTKLHIGDGGTGTVDSAYSLAIEGDGIDGVHILTANDQQGRIVFGDAQDNDIGQVRYDHSDNSMTFRVNTSDAMTITGSTGNVGIGTTTPLTPLHVNAGSNNQKVATFTGNNTTRGLEITTYQESNHDAGVILDAVDASHGTLKFQTSTDDAMIITKNQKVGIGNMTPPEVLTVTGNISASGEVNVNVTDALFSSKITIGGDAYSTGAFKVGSAATNVGKMTNTNGVLTLTAEDNRDIQFGDTSTTASIYIDNSAEKVGIGTKTPGEKLEVVGNIRANVSNAGGFMITGNAASGLVRSNATGVALRTNTTDRLIINSDGDVGIGTGTEPPEKLTVEGNISSSGNAIIKGNITASSNAGIAGALGVGVSSHHASFGFYNQNTAYFNGQVTVNDSLAIDAGSVSVSGPGHITASGNISASGNVIASGNILLDENGYLQLNNTNNNNPSFIGNQGSNATQISFMLGSHGNANARFKIEDSKISTLKGADLFVSGALEVESHTTASGNISASGEVYGQKFGAGSTNLLDFSTTNSIIFRTNNSNRLRFDQSQFYPVTNNGVSLGTATNSFSDLFLATGAVINFHNGDVTLTHSSNTLTLGGGTFVAGDVSVTNITSSGNISSSGTGENFFNGDFKFDGDTTISTVGSSDDISINPAAELNLGTSNADVVQIGRQSSAVPIKIFAGSSTPTFEAKSGHITASGNISSSGTVHTKFLQLPQAGAGGTGDSSIHFGSPGGNNGHIYDDGQLRLGYNDSDNISLTDGSTTISSIKAKFNGNITASGTISASKDILTSGSFRTNADVSASGDGTNEGRIFAGQFYAHQAYRLNDASGTSRHVLTNGSDDLTIEIGNANMTSGVSLVGNVTASNNISASGTIFTNKIEGHTSLALGDPDGNSNASRVIINQSDTSVSVFNADLVVGQTGGGEKDLNVTGTGSFGHILMAEQTRISFDNESSNDQFITGTDHNITIDGDNNVNLEADVGVNLNTPLVTATGNISASGDHTALNLTATGSNNLLNTSASGNLIGNRFFKKSSTADYFLAQGDIIYTGGGSTTKGDIVYMNTSGNWASARADATSTSTSLLGIALGTDPDVNGVLLRGTVTLDHDVANNQGVPLYISTSAAGQATATIPSADGHIVRIIGYNLGDNDEIWFNPDNTFVEINA